MKPGILVTRAMFPEVLERLRETFDVIDNQADFDYPPEALAERLQGHVGLLSNAADTINAELISRVPRCERCATWPSAITTLISRR